MKIGIDIMGGDFAPRATTLGSILAARELPQNVKLVLFGDTDQILSILKDEKVDPSLFEIVHTTEVIEMGEHPSKAFTKKQDSGIALGFRHLSENRIDGFASAGNTGAMMVGAMFTSKLIGGIIRPCISSIIPSLNGKNSILLDVGINADCKPEVLLQYALIGSAYAEMVYGVENPRVGLLNIGSEEEKGNLLSRATYELMKESTAINFIGNIEGTDLLLNKADVIVTDGFTGNVVLKEAEAFFHAIKERNIQDEFFDRFNFEIYGGTPILGINAPVCIGHGISNEIAIKNMIRHTYEVAESKLVHRIKEIFEI
jgi:glycerol-3-phosphate acyltransferase PlsX